MTGDIISDFASVWTWLIHAYTEFGWLFGIVSGYFVVVSVNRYMEEKESFEITMGLAGVFIVLGPIVHFGIPAMMRLKMNAPDIAPIYLVFWGVGFSVGIALGWLWYRKGEPTYTEWKRKYTNSAKAERDKKTDVRTVRELLPKTPDIYDIMKYYKPGFITVGIDKAGEPIRVSFDIWRSNHIQLSGTTGAGKGVAAQMALVQAIKEGEVVFVFDPKDDEWLPHVLHSAAKVCNVPYYYIDLRDGQPSQINPLIGVGRAELNELFIAAFALGEKGTEADHYRLADRRAARIVAEFMADLPSPSFSSCLPMITELEEVKVANGFLGKFEEMAGLESINAKNIGVDFGEMIANGGVIYLVGSMRHETVKSAQRMMMVRLVQICEKRDRLKAQRSVCVFLDELKYHLSKPAMEIFGAARDKGLHALVAHQSITDLRDVPQDLDPDAVVGSVIENTGLKMIYKLQDPDTAEWLAKRSGTKLVDMEHRRVGRNIAQSEIMDDDRMLRQDETYLIDTNMLMNLPNRVAVWFSEDLPQFVGTSPVPVEKSLEAIKIEQKGIERLTGETPADTAIIGGEVKPSELINIELADD